MPRYSTYGGYGDAITATDRAIAVEVKTPFAQRPLFVSASINEFGLVGGEFGRVIVYTGELDDLSATLLIHAGNWEFVRSCGISRLLATATFPFNGATPFKLDIPQLEIPSFGSLPGETLGAALLLPCDKNLNPMAACYATFSFFGVPLDGGQITKYKVV